MSELAARAIDAVNAVDGVREGRRALHAKGALCAATFTANSGAAALTRAAHMNGDEVRAHVRFSNAPSDPDGADFEHVGRGMATKFYLPGGETTDLVAVMSPVFLARTPEDFVELMEARAPDPDTGEPDMAKVGAYIEAHPEALPAIQHTLGGDPPESYLRSAYNSLHAFKLVDADGGVRFVRYRWEPRAGAATISDEDARAKGADYLQKDLAERLGQGPAMFTLLARLAEPGDSLTDPTSPWPEEREAVELGTLTITAPAADRERDGDVLVFDPTRVTDGIECSDDPILWFRSDAYAESVLRRSGVRRN